MVIGAVELKVTVSALPFVDGVSCDGLTLHVAGALAAAGVIAHVNETAFGNAPPRAVTVACIVAVWPAFTLVAAGEMETPKSKPIPETATIWGLPNALSLMLNVPLRSPLAVGSKTTAIVQLVPGVTLAGQPLFVVKSLPAVIPLITNGASP